MIDKETSFSNTPDLEYALKLLNKVNSNQNNLPNNCPNEGIGEINTLNLLAPHVLGNASYLDSQNALAHMDPPTPWITWAMALWNARLNQNLLHPAVSPFATEAEKLVIKWLIPFFGMEGGHMCSGSTIANLTAIWVARDSKNIIEVVTSQSAHLSVEKAAKILGLKFRKVPTNSKGQIDSEKLGDLSSACLVLTAGTTTSGAIDSLKLIGKAKWTHVDGAWAAPLRLSSKYSKLLDNIQNADSISISTHKWFFQPKDSALVLFKDIKTSNEAISFGGSYLTTPNVGVQGSRGASAIPLLATLIAFGKDGIVELIEHSINMSNKLYEELTKEKNISVLEVPQTAITIFRPLNCTTERFFKQLPQGMFSTCILDDKLWIRSVAVNPLANIDEIISSLKKILQDNNV